ncbi:MAG: hypothetical protein PUC12_01020 [Clostridiales bacterium]|nr:hypothetical protein [Clostridiales bacterium]
MVNTIVKEEYRKQIYDTEQFADGTVPKKWRLGDQQVEQLILPYTVHHIEDWAFAHCRNVKEIWLPKRKLTTGQGILDGCDNLLRIVVYELTEEKISIYEDEAELLACAVRFAPIYDVLDVTDIGTEKWYDWLDEQICRYLVAPDDKGFDPFLAGGEEDYEDPANHVEYYRFLRQQEKSLVLLARLGQGKYLKPEQEEIYGDYMSGHEEALLAVLLEKREQAYSDLAICGKLGVISLGNVDNFLKKMDEQCFTESRAYLLHLKEEMRKQDAKGEIWEAWSL